MTSHEQLARQTQASFHSAGTQRAATCTRRLSHCIPTLHTIRRHQAVAATGFAELVAASAEDAARGGSADPEAWNPSSEGSPSSGAALLFPSQQMLEQGQCRLLLSRPSVCSGLAAPSGLATTLRKFCTWLGF